MKIAVTPCSLPAVIVSVLLSLLGLPLTAILHTVGVPTCHTSLNSACHTSLNVAHESPQVTACPIIWGGVRGLLLGPGEAQ